MIYLLVRVKVRQLCPGRRLVGVLASVVAEAPALTSLLEIVNADDEGERRWQVELTTDDGGAEGRGIHVVRGHECLLR